MTLVDSNVKDVAEIQRVSPPAKQLQFWRIFIVQFGSDLSQFLPHRIKDGMIYHYPVESPSWRMRFCVQDAFFYSLVYDNQQKSLIADHGEIRVGLRYQVEIIPDKLESRMSLSDVCILTASPRI